MLDEIEIAARSLHSVYTILQEQEKGKHWPWVIHKRNSQECVPNLKHGCNLYYYQEKTRINNGICQKFQGSKK